MFYSFDRSSQLRSLTLVDFDTIGTSLTEAMKKLPQLEELDLFLEPPLDLEDFETIGFSCPKLKSFTYREDQRTGCLEFTEYAVAIGKTMPSLHHLRLFVCEMNINGLEAILGGCSQLESLEFRGDSDLDLGGSLAKRCSDQIKDLKLDCTGWRDDSDLGDYDKYDLSSFNNDDDDAFNNDDDDDESSYYSDYYDRDSYDRDYCDRDDYDRDFYYV